MGFWDEVGPHARDFVGCVKNMVIERGRAMFFLEGSVETLRNEMVELGRYRSDKETEVGVEERKTGWKRTHMVDGWLKDVDDLRCGVDAFDASFKGSKSPLEDSCSWPCLKLQFKNSGVVASWIKKVREVKEKGEKLKNLTIEAGSDRAGCGSYGVQMVGDGGEALQEILRYLVDDEVGIVNIYGMGGIGKSTLLQRIRYEFDRNRPEGFEPPLMADVPSPIETQIQELRNKIGGQLNLPQPSNWEADSLKNALASKKFLLLLDNVWEELNLDAVGIPIPDAQNKCKIVLTARSRDACSQPKAKKVKVKLLEKAQAFELFRRYVGNEDIMKASFKPHAEDIVAECCGLPLALITMGRVMSDKIDYRDWAATVELLKDSRKHFKDMEEKVFKVLQFSYDNLSPERQPCFSYCSLFPSKYEIDREQLKEYWMGEGFLDINGTISDLRGVRYKGSDIINQLIDACLLEYDSNVTEAVKMHDVVRDMVLWLAKEEFWVHTKSESRPDLRGESWEHAKRVSLMQSNTSALPPEPNCGNLSTLLVNGNITLKSIPDHFFRQMADLRVLDLSNTKIENLPTGIGGLRKLYYLNLSYTNIRSLPKEMGCLEKLRQLNLSFTSQLVTIPYEAISGLSALTTLNLFNSGYVKWQWDLEVPERGVSFQDMEKLKQLKEIGLNIAGLDSFDCFMNSTVWQQTVCLCLEGFKGLTPENQSHASKIMRYLRELHIENFFGLREWIFLGGENLLKLESLKLINLPEADIIWKEVPSRSCMLSKVDISGCHRLTTLTWVRHLSCLQTISVKNCKGLKSVIGRDGGEDDDTVCFENLRTITLESLLSLESICVSPMRMELHSLVPNPLRVVDCPKLRGEMTYHDKHGMQQRIPYPEH